MTLVREGLLILALILVPAVVGMTLVHRLAPAAFRRSNREAADPVWAIAGGAFGLLLGFMVVTLWDDLQKARETVQDEANDIVNLYELTYALPEGANPPALRAQLEGYTRLIVDDEWDELGRHRSSEEAERAMDNLWRSYLGLEQLLGADSLAYSESIERLPDLQDARNRRINAAESRVPAALWAVVIGGIAVMIVMIWFTGSEDFRTHLLMTVVLSVSLAAILFLIRVFNNPFQGTVRADPAPMERALIHFEKQR